MADDDAPQSWLTLQRGAGVVTSDGTDIGKVTEVIGDTQKDIFSGIAISSGLFDADRFVPADAVAGIGDDVVTLNVTSDQASSLQPYEG